MPKEDFIHGQSKVEDFWKFINDRHAIYLKRKAGELKPWSDDLIFQEWKFTNVFRELDRGTIVLRRMLKQLYAEYIERQSSKLFPDWAPDKIKADDNAKRFNSSNYIRNQFITCILYRMFNWHGNAKFGPIDNPTAWYKYLRNKQDNGDQIFGGAYILPSYKGEEKLVTFERVCRNIVKVLDQLIWSIQDKNTLEHTWNLLNTVKHIGPFISYEFVCDLRYTDILRNATDTCTWCNIGPGAERGLQRMGLNVTLESIIKLFSLSGNDLTSSNIDGKYSMDQSHWIWGHKKIEHKYARNIQYPYWELREIEHCLCEFDKYERIRLGQGGSKVKFSGV